MYRLKKLLSLSALATTLAAAAVAAPAQAAPDWTLPTDLRDPSHAWVSPLLGYADGGVELGAHFESSTLGGFGETVVLTRRTAGHDLAEEARFDASAGLTLSAIAFDVAGNGAAVVSWAERDGGDTRGKQVMRAAYRTPAGAWEAPVTIAADDNARFTSFPQPAAAIGSGGTAVAGAAHSEADSATEFQADGRVDVRVHPAGDKWGDPTRLSLAERSATDLALGVARDGTGTAAYAERSSEGISSSPSDDDASVHVRRWSASTGSWGGVEDLGNGPGTSASGVKLGLADNGRALLTWQKTYRDGKHFAAVARRDGGSVAFGTPGFVVGDIDHRPLAAGVAPDGTSYLLLDDNDAANRGVLAVRGKPGAAFEPARNIGLNVASSGEIGFLGNDAVLGFTSSVGGAVTPQAAVWPTTATVPLAAHVFETKGSIFTQIVSDGEGSVVATWNLGNRPRVAAFDGTAPRPVAASVPRSGEVGTELTVSAQFGDLFSRIDGDPIWDFGDGATGQAPTLTHTYAAPGDYTVTVRGRDVRGNERSATFPVTIAPHPQPDAPATSGTPTAPAAPTSPADSTAPTVKLKLPARKVRRRRSAWQTLRGTVTDAQPSAGIKRIEVLAFRLHDKRKVRLATLSGSAWKRKLPKLRRGTWTFRVRAIDNAGHASKPVRQRVKLR